MEESGRIWPLFLASSTCFLERDGSVWQQREKRRMKLSELYWHFKVFWWWQATAFDLPDHGAKAFSRRAQIFALPHNHGWRSDFPRTRWPSLDYPWYSAHMAPFRLKIGQELAEKHEMKILLGGRPIWSNGPKSSGSWSTTPISSLSENIISIILSVY